MKVMGPKCGLKVERMGSYRCRENTNDADIVKDRNMGIVHPEPAPVLQSTGTCNHFPDTASIWSLCNAVEELSSYRPLFEALSKSKAKKKKLLDLGGHMGVITVETRLRGVPCVAVEPFPSNANALRGHLAFNNVRAEVLEGAAVGPGHEGTTTTLYVATGTNMGTYTVRATAGRKPITCDAVPLLDWSAVIPKPWAEDGP